MADRLQPWTMLGPPPGTCPECAVDHPPDQPHDRQSLCYQYTFYRARGSWPTWADAMAHCDETTRARWTAALVERGVDVGTVTPKGQ
jgi:hypothetical protein